MKKWVSGLGLIFLLLGCRKNIDNPEAVREGVVDYLKKRNDLATMDVSIASVSFKENEATAQVHFQAKDNPNGGGGLDIPYILERKGNQWVVKGRLGGAAANPHGGMNGTNPHGSMGMPGGAQLPPGHPAVGGQQPPSGTSK